MVITFLASFSWAHALCGHTLPISTRAARAMWLEPKYRRTLQALGHSASDQFSRPLTYPLLANELPKAIVHPLHCFV